MDTNTLRMFLKIADGATFQSVAYDENISQSSLSKAIHRLEDDLGVKLFDRTFRNVTLTSAGIVFRDNIREILNDLQKTTDNIRAIANNNSINLGIVPVLTTWHMQTYLSSFTDIFNDIPLNIITPESTDIALTWLRKHSSKNNSCVIAHLPVEKELYNVHVLHQDRIVAILPKGHRLANHDELTPSDLLDEPILLSTHAASTNHSLYALPVLRPIMDNVVQVMPRRELAISKVIAGKGIAQIGRAHV